MSTAPVNEFYWEYDLAIARREPRARQPAAHQREALEQLSRRFEGRARPYDGGILVLPTGGGKTFTAIRFLCTVPLSQGFKVLWLAHTHHLLEQARKSFTSEVGLIAEPKQRLNVRVVSGAPGHNPPRAIRPTDDVVIGTLQTIGNAKQRLPQFNAWLKAAGEQLLVVFDEAHHAPAYSYRTLIESLRASNPGMYLLGLTATPTYTDERRSGFLNRLFPQRCIYQVPTQKLMAQSILARPVFEDHRTDFDIDFDEREYQKWIGSYRDLPEEIISKLAASKERNAYIAQTYIANRERYGKTIIFADRWFQCEQICAFLRGPDDSNPVVRAGAIYTHIDADPGTPEARNRRTADENALVLDAFRRGELDVLVNVRMLTEGTDVPDINTVFLTRQTTSQILLTQMIGRALRGPAFGGTESAYIVSFIDSWKHLINWAEYQIPDGEALDEAVVTVKRPPLQYISIDLVRHVIWKMGQGEAVELAPFLTLLPAGWYRVEFLAQVEGSDEQATVQQMVMVYDGERDAFEQFIAALAEASIEEYEDEQASLEAHREQLEAWRRSFFADARERVGEELLISMFHIARHVASAGKAPDFFPFEERAHHDLDAIARDCIAADLGPTRKHQTLTVEYQRADRYWSVIYPSYALFKSQYDACENAIVQGVRDVATPAGLITCPEQMVPREPSAEVKAQIKERDGYRCLSCGEYRRELLQVDHVAPFYHGGTNALGNLQTLCRVCNNEKGINEVNFRSNQTPFAHQPTSAPTLELPPPSLAGDLAAWEQFLRRSVNFFYRCAAVASVTLADGEAETWAIQLWAGNPHHWLEPQLPELLQRIAQQRFAGGRAGPAKIIVGAPGHQAISVELPPVTVVLRPGVELPPAPTSQPDASAARFAQAPSPAQDESWLVLTTASGGVLQQRLLNMRAQGRGGRGLWVAGYGDGTAIFTAQLVSPADTLLFFSNFGRAYALPAAELAQGTEETGVALSDYINLSKDEEIWATLGVQQFASGEDLVLATQFGKIKRTPLTELARLTTAGRTIINSDAPVRVGLVRPVDEILLMSIQGQAIRFSGDEVPQQGAEAGGVAGLRLAGDDELCDMQVVPSATAAADLLVVSRDGYAKRTPLADVPRQGRGGSGVILMGGRPIAGARLITQQREAVFVSRAGMALRTAVGGIARQGRSAQGVSVMRLADNDELVTVVIV
jgi:ATP-dependent helicase IRC3